MNIDVNEAKCGNAMDCRVCLEMCPGRVFLIAPSGETSTIVPVLLSQCIECDLCVEKCPKEAITLQH